MFSEITHDDVFRLETPRLWLRWPEAGDAPAVEAVASRRDVADMTARIPHPYPVGAAQAWIAGVRQANEQGSGLRLVAQLMRGDRRVIGMAGIEAVAGDAAELGYAFHPDVWGEGLATEAAQALIDAAFALSRINAVRADARVVNPASRRVLQKCGFAYEGAGMVELRARGGLLPVEHFVLDRKTWASLKGWGTRRTLRPGPATAGDRACA